jgi:hypothetical protein
MKALIAQLEERFAPSRCNLWDFVANLTASAVAASSDAGSNSIIQANGDTVVTSDGHSQQAVVVPAGSAVAVSTSDNGHAQAVTVADGQSTVVTGSGGNSAVVVGSGSATVVTQGRNWGHHQWFHRVW